MRRIVTVSEMRGVLFLKLQYVVESNVSGNLAAALMIEQGNMSFR